MHKLLQPQQQSEVDLPHIRPEEAMGRSTAAAAKGQELQHAY
jgi:hypothetical protein